MKFAVIGLGRFGTKLAVTLAREGADVIALDIRKEPVERIKEHVSVAISMDATDEEALHLQDIDKVDTAVVCIGGHFEANVLITALLKNMGVPHVCSRGLEGLQSRILKLLGADRVIHPEEDMAQKLGQSLITRGIVDLLPLSGEYHVVEIEAPEPLWGKSLEEVALRRKYHVNIIGFKVRSAPKGGKGENEKEGRTPERFLVPEAETIIEPHHVMIVVGKEKDINTLARIGA